jgi:hypothetical protein
MTYKFKTWSEVSPTAKGSLAPSFELRGWEDLTKEDKVKIIKHLHSLGWFKSTEDALIIVDVVDSLNYNYKVHTYGQELFDMGGPQTNTYFRYTEETKKAAIRDFVRIIKNDSVDVVFELLSYYAKKLIDGGLLRGKPSDESVDKAFKKFDKFSNAINDIFSQFSINLSLTRQGFVPKQEQIVHDLIIEPTFRGLSSPQWKSVQSNFSDAMNEYQKGTKTTYSNAITHIVSALQAYLQIKVIGTVGKGDISDIINEGIEKNSLPNDSLSLKVMKGLSSTLMEYRQKQGDAHPKAEYATEESVRLVLNVAAVFIQHCNK